MTALRLNDPSLAADHIEWELLEGGRVEYSRGDLDPDASWTVVAEDVADEKHVNDSSTSAHAAKADDTLNQIAYRCASLKGAYALELSAGVVRRLAAPVSADADLVYRFLLACSRPDTSQALGDTFTELCKLALSRFFGGRASVWNIDARSPDRVAMGGTTPKVVSFLAPKIGARVKAVPHGQLAAGGDGGCDLVATFDFNDQALGHLTVLGQCAASSNTDYWRNKIAEPRRFAHNYELTALPLYFMFIPYVYRSSDGTWQNEANCSDMVLFDRGRILRTLALDKEPLPAKLTKLLTGMMKLALAKAKKKAARKKSANKKTAGGKAAKKAVKKAAKRLPAKNIVKSARAGRATTVGKQLASARSKAAVFAEIEKALRMPRKTSRKLS